jgi:hypothetical protein
MQSIEVPQGPHNPNGYTREEILDAARGISGSRHLTFRYELLDMHDEKIRDLDLDEMEECSIEQNWLAEIKRKASMRIRDFGQINWLTDRVKPWVQFRMPPRVSHEGEQLDVLWHNTFDGPDNEAVTPSGSTAHGDNVSSVSGSVEWSDVWAAAGDRSVRLGANDGTSSGSFRFGIRARSTYRIRFYANIPANGNLHFRLGEDTGHDIEIDDLNEVYRLGGVDVSHIASDLTGQPFRLDMIDNGRRIRYRIWWTDIHSDDSPDFFVSENSAEREMIRMLEFEGGGQDEDPSFVDDVEVRVPGDPEVVPRLRPVWRNSFNGTPGGPATMSNISSHGNGVSMVRGRAFYSDDWSADERRSLQLGDEEGDNAGQIEFPVPARRTWNLRFYANVPEGGHLSVMPSAAEAVQPPDTVHEAAGHPEHVNTTTAGGFQTNVTASVPAGTVDGHYMMAFISANGEDVLTPPAGWTEVTSHTIATGTTVWLYERFAEDEPASYQWSFSGEHHHWVVTSTYSGTIGVRDHNLHSASNASSIPLPQMNAEDHELLIAAGFHWSNTPKEWDDDDELTTVANLARSWNVGFQDVNEGITPAYTMTAGTSGRLAAIAMLLEPESATGPEDEPPVQPEANEPFWVILDDANEQYSIAGVDVSDFSDVIVGQPIRVELETDGDIFQWRVYHVDPHGDTADISWVGDSRGWTDIVSFVVHGGGDQQPPPLFDNMRLADPVPTRRETPAEQNFVEWPQGVFLLTTPSRTLNEHNVVLRDVDGFDKLQIYEDDITDGRIGITQISEVWDRFLRTQSGSWGTTEIPNISRNWVAEVSTAATFGVERAWATATLSATDPIRQMVIDERTSTRDVEVRGSASVTQEITGGPSRLGIAVRWQNSSDYYRVTASITTNQEVDLQVWRAGTTMGSAATNVLGDPLSYNTQFVEMRVRIIGDIIQARCWTFEQDEPTDWQIERDITEFPDEIQEAGRVGVTFNSHTDNSNSNLTHRWRLFRVLTAPDLKYTDLISTLLGDVPKQITPSSESVPFEKEWEPNTTKRQIINDLLDAINYESLSFDEHGTAIVQPYIAPQDRPAEYDYFDDSVSVMHSEMEQELDLHQIPNRWISSVSDPDRPAFTAKIENRDPASPTSIPRRGRVITEYVDPGESSSRSTLYEQLVRIAQESTQIFEAVEFSTAIMPWHSGNDVYRIRREKIGVSSKYAEHTWEFRLEAGAEMRHRARRVVTLDMEFDDSVVIGDLHVTGALSADNIAMGDTLVTPVANTPTSTVIFGLDLAGTGVVRGQATLRTTVPQTAQMQSVYFPTPFGVTLFVYRTNTTNTRIAWMLVREP